MGYEKMIGLTPEERREMMKQVRREIKQDTIPFAPSVWEGRVSPEVKEFMEEADGIDFDNDETPDEKKQRAKNRKAAKSSQKGAGSKHRRYWERPTENEALKGKKR